MTPAGAVRALLRSSCAGAAARASALATIASAVATSALATIASALAAIALMSGCAGLPAPPAPMPEAIDDGVTAPPRAPDLRGQRIVLLGEVHDNGTQHALRLAAFRALLDSGARPALLMEQIDRDRQADLDRARAATAPPDAAALIDAIGGLPGWERRYYEPFIALALAHGLPIVAVNVSRADARRVMAEGLAATGFDPSVPADIAQAHVQEIVESHCGQVDRRTAGRMADAQAARDQEMARLVARHAGRGVVLLAGNGHVRKDVGVVRWLPPALQAQTRVYGFLEGAPAPQGGTFDRTIVTSAPEDRPDPCATLPERMTR